MDLTVDELLARGGWVVEDPRPRHARNPDSFWLPDDELRAAIGPGSLVRLLLWFVDEEELGDLLLQCERMWALVEVRDGDVLHGRLTSPPVSSRAPLEMGQLIEFRATDAIDVLDPEHDWREHREFLQAIAEGDEAFERWKQAQPKGD